MNVSEKKIYCYEQRFSIFIKEKIELLATYNAQYIAKYD